MFLGRTKQFSLSCLASKPVSNATTDGSPRSSTESYGIRTFSAKEMAFNILGLMHPLLFSITQVEPIWADLNGGMDRLPDLADITTRIRLSLNKKSELRRVIARDNAADFKVINGLEAERVFQTVNVTPRANFCFDFPALESPESLSDMAHLQGIIDLDKVIVITGFAEVGPCAHLMYLSK
jgi:fatty acid synthase subunit beta